MTDVILKGFPPEHQPLALELAQRYAIDDASAPSGASGSRSFDLWAERGLRGYLYWTKAREVAVVCSAIKKERKFR